MLEKRIEVLEGESHGEAAGPLPGSIMDGGRRPGSMAEARSSIGSARFGGFLVKPVLRAAQDNIDRGDEIVDHFRSRPRLVLNLVDPVKSASGALHRCPQNLVVVVSVFRRR